MPKRLLAIVQESRQHHPHLWTGLLLEIELINWAQPTELLEETKLFDENSFSLVQWVMQIFLKVNRSSSDFFHGKKSSEL